MTAAACTTCGRSGLSLHGGRCGTCRAGNRTEVCGDCGSLRRVSTRSDDGTPRCTTCTRRRHAAVHTVEFHAEATSIVAAWMVSDESVVRAAVESAAPNLRQAEWLTGALAEGPTVLQGSTTAPPVIDRLVAALATGGAVGVALPCCVCCGRSTRLTQRLDGHRACEICAQRTRLQPCSRCGRSRRITVRGSDGQGVCNLCYRADRTRWEPCAACGQVRLIVRRLAGGDGLCPRCSRQVAACSLCGHERRCAGVAEGRPRCDPCSKRRVPCSGCGRVATVSVVWAIGPVCSTCRVRGLEAKAICDGCGQMRRPDPRHPSGRCADCVGMPRFQVCTECGAEDRLHRHGRCWRCLMLLVFDTLTVDSTVELRPLRVVLAGSERPRAVLRWLETSFVSNALRQIATGTVTLTHTSIDALGGDVATGRLRAVLVQAGLLEPRDEAIARLEGWIDRQLDTVGTVEDRRLLEAFARWWVLRRARQRAQRSPGLSTRTARREVRRAIELVDFLRGHGTDLASCSQADIDLWLAGPPSRVHVRAFVRWARRQRLCDDLTVPKQRQAWPARHFTADELRDVATMLLTTGDLDAADRLAGLLVVCYAQTPARVSRLRVDHVRIDGATVSVRFGTDHVELPPVIGALMTDVIQSRRGRAATMPTATSRWVFPGGLPGRPIDSGTLQLRLQAIGIRSMATRTSALLDLAAEVPASILADLVGLHPATASRWTRAAGGYWTTYTTTKTRSTRATSRTDPAASDNNTM